MIDVVRVTPAQREEHARFVRACPEAMIYAALEYCDVLARIVPGEAVCLAARDRGRIVGTLPYFRAEQPGFGAVINSLPWFGSHGGCLLAPDAGPEARAALVRAYADAASAADVLSATLIVTPQENGALADYRRALEPSHTDHRIGQITTLPEQGAELDRRLESGIMQKTRNLVRKSLKQDFKLVERDDDWAWRALCRLHQVNMAAIGGRAKPWEHFEALRDGLPAGWRKVWIAMAEDEPVAALLLLYCNRTVEYCVPASKLEFRSRQPLSFLIWHGMKDAVSRGFRWWNWGGTWGSQSSLHHFKAGWGAEDRPYTYLIRLTERGLAALLSRRGELQTLFPFYYTHPYALEQAASGAAR
jgi:hypothetical protein